MKETEQKAEYFFVDESGDPIFYSKGGDIVVGQPSCSRILLLRFARVEALEPVREWLAELQ